eukprot:SAG31_NODE_474_length_15176_cov_7.362340_16_plen_148_part_00
MAIKKLRIQMVAPAALLRSMQLALLGVRSVVAAGAALKPPAAWVPCNASAGICFSYALGDYVVLQQAPARACVYGMLGSGGTGATVKISSSQNPQLDSEVAELVAELGAGGAWKACLSPHQQGGDFTITATCVVRCFGLKFGIPTSP